MSGAFSVKRAGLGERGVERSVGSLGFHLPSMTAETGGSANRKARNARRPSSDVSDGLLWGEQQGQRLSKAHKANGSYSSP